MESIINIETTIDAPLELVWKCWTTPSDIMLWNNASSDWHTPHAENDLKENGQFCYRMEAKDGSFGFDFGGVYTKVIPMSLIKYTIGDGRKVEVHFSEVNNHVLVKETFEAEKINPIEMQRSGWLAILENFKKYVENKK